MNSTDWLIKGMSEEELLSEKIEALNEFYDGVMNMNCPKCGSKTTVLDGVLVPTSNEHYRKRECKTCSHEFCTVEFEVTYDERVDREWKQFHRLSGLKKKRKEDRANKK